MPEIISIGTKAPTSNGTGAVRMPWPAVLTAVAMTFGIGASYALLQSDLKNLEQRVELVNRLGGEGLQKYELTQAVEMDGLRMQLAIVDNDLKYIRDAVSRIEKQTK